jgi:glucosamine-phosphate N-acetyltransferase
MENIREIEENDFEKGYMNLINYFTRYPEPIPFNIFKETLIKIQQSRSKIFVIEENGRIVATLTCMIEQKLHNNCKRVGHIEDLVVEEQSRKKGYASILLQKAIDYGKDENCYKIVLQTNQPNIGFYEKNGFNQKGIEMTKYLL